MHHINILKSSTAQRNNSSKILTPAHPLMQPDVKSLLYYTQAVDNKRLVALSTIISQQTAATQNTAIAVHQLLDYVATYPNDGITYSANAMVLAAHSDTSFSQKLGHTAGLTCRVGPQCSYKGV
eukprot:CCRYP_000988-RA/>CCRYP_000988-RA protein AED:0.54 eAED:0.67 QI:0/0/0/1/0/0/2/0/123